LIRKIKIASLVHDIGKIGIQESVLGKASFLSREEFEIVKTHCEVGEHILSPVIKDVEILNMVRHHHERFDGKGYPDGHIGAAIHQQAAALDLPGSITRSYLLTSHENASYIGASIIAVADSYDAMTTQRPYRDAMSPEKACMELRRLRGQQFDPSVVDAFLRFLNRNGEGLSPEPGLTTFYLLK
jgi:HD-GYP domain-containing protein (c-di-GMP phosphodiesterase class II)